MDRDSNRNQFLKTSDDELFELLRTDAGKGGRRDQVFEVLFQRYHAKVFRWCRRYVQDDSLAEDVTQKVFVELIDRAPRYPAVRRFGAWLFVVTRSRCLNAIRSRRRHGEEELDAVLLDFLHADDDPHGDIEHRELREHIDEVCGKHLKSREQEVIHLRYTLGLKVAEITALLGLENASGARTHLRSAESKLRRHLGHLIKEWNPK